MAPVIIRLTSFEKHKTDKDVFYSSSTGYKMCVSVHANGFGDGEGTHLAVANHLLKGVNDHSLAWPFTGKTVFELLNQLANVENLKQTTPSDMANVYC